MNDATTRDEGSSLIELVVAVALMGIVVASILGGMWSAVRMSSISDDQARVEAVLGSAADRLANYAYIPCPSTTGSSGYLPIVQAAAGTVDWPTSTVSISQQSFWEPTGAATGSWQASNGISGTQCNESVSLTTSRTLQKITIRVTSPSGLSRTLEVVKNNVFPKQVGGATASSS